MRFIARKPAFWLSICALSLLAACNEDRVGQANNGPVLLPDGALPDATLDGDFPIDPDGGPIGPDGGPIEPDGGPIEPDVIGPPPPLDVGPGPDVDLDTIGPGPDINGDVSPDTVLPDIGLDVIVDAEPDTVVPDIGPDVILDVSPDTVIPDVGPDVIADVSPDTVIPDVGPDVIADVTPDTIVPDVGPDVIADVTPDTIVPDIGPDVVADVTPDTIVPDIGPDVVADVTPDTIVPDIGPDVIADVTPDTIVPDVGPDVVADVRPDTDVAPDVIADVQPDTIVPDVGPDVSPGVCGNGVQEPGEQCDDGRGNGAVPDACRPDCTLPFCGDGIVDGDEDCDDGNRIDGDACSNGCVPVQDALCELCTANGQCGRPQDLCVVLDGGRFCASACTATSQCPADFVCANATSVTGTSARQCIPASGTCVGCVDNDGDGYGVGASCAGPDCNDANGNIFPGATELCDGLDNDCDGAIDEGAIGAQPSWPDLDGDGFGDRSAVPVRGCGTQPGFANNDLDCDDRNPSINPRARELCGDGVDNNCNGAIDCDDLACSDTDVCADPLCYELERLDGPVGPAVVTGTTVGAGDDLSGTCGGAGAPDYAVRYRASRSAFHVFSTNGTTFPNALYVTRGCDGPQLACGNSGAGNASQVGLPLNIGDDVLVVVDGNRGGSGPFTLNVGLQEQGYCQDGVDNDGDGRIDCADTECSLSPFCCPDDIFEPNQGNASSPSTTFAAYQANRGATLNVKPGDDDFFNLPICRGAQVVVAATFSHAQGNIDLALLINAAGQTIQAAQANSTTDNELLTWTVPNVPGIPSNAFLRVRNNTAGTCNSYQLSITIRGC